MANYNHEEEKVTGGRNGYGANDILIFFSNQVVKSTVIYKVMLWEQFKPQTEMNEQCSLKKTVILKGIAKLEDANDAGTILIDGFNEWRQLNRWLWLVKTNTVFSH